MADAKYTDAMRLCNSCKQEKPANTDYFRAEKRTLIGLQSRCRNCEREYRRQRRKENPEADRLYYEANKAELLKKQSKYAKTRRRNNPEEVLAVQAAYREKNREKIRQYQSKWYEKNRQKERKRLNEYYQKNPDKRAEANARREAWRRQNRDKARSYMRNRRARIAEVGGTHSGEDIAKIFDGQKGHCWWCTKKLGKKYHVDHRIPIAKGGSNGPENLVIACPKCNQYKGSRMPWEMEIPRLF